MEEMLLVKTVILHGIVDLIEKYKRKHDAKGTWYKYKTTVLIWNVHTFNYVY